MSTGSSQVGAVLSPPCYYISYHYTFPGFPFILIFLSFIVDMTFTISALQSSCCARMYEEVVPFLGCPPSTHWLKAVSPSGCFRDLYTLFSPGCQKWSWIYVVNLFCLTCEELVTAPSWAVLVRPVISISQSQASW